jgi:hypothetical protein
VKERERRIRRDREGGGEREKEMEKVTLKDFSGLS